MGSDQAEQRRDAPSAGIKGSKIKVRSGQVKESWRWTASDSEDDLRYASGRRNADATNAFRFGKAQAVTMLPQASGRQQRQPQRLGHLAGSLRR